MSSEIAIKVENLSKCYQIYDQPGDRLKQFLLPRTRQILGMQPKPYYREFWALKNVSIEVKKGEIVGVVGRNGSGKSTLLQLICGTLNPTSGNIETNGRIAALLELGSGFNPDFTGRENVYLNASLLGLSKDEVDERLDEILAFADIGQFIDQPVKTYSSGMVVRLAFAVQAQVKPDVLIVDEALAVGDAKFQSKCFECLRQLKDKGTSILLVTHSSEQIVTHASRAILMDEGCVVEYGKPRHIVNCYVDLLFGKKRKDHLTPPSSITSNPTRTEEVECVRPQLNYADDIFATHNGYNQYEYRWGDGAAAILDFYLTADDEPYPSLVASGQVVEIGVAIRFYETLVRPILGITIKTKEGVTVYGVNSETLEADEIKTLGTKGTTALARATFTCRLAPGDYFISFGIATRESEGIVPHDRRYDSIHMQVSPNETFFGLVNLNLNLRAEEAPL